MTTTAPLLDQTPPPLLTIGKPRGVRQRLQRVLSSLRRRLRCCPHLRSLTLRLMLALIITRRTLPARTQRLRQINEPHLRLIRQPPSDRLPLRRKLRKRVVRSIRWHLRVIHQQRHRRHHLRLRRQPQHLRRIRRPLDQHRVGPDRLQRAQHHPGRARPMMTDAQDVQLARHDARSRPATTELPLQHFLARAIQVLPPLALLHHRLEILLHHHLVLHRILHDRADDPARDVRRLHLAIPKV